MADDLSLQLIIKAILDSKGFEEAKASLGELATKANAAAPAADDLGKKTAKMGEELKAGRIAASGLTNILLQQIGVTGSAGTAARAAASGVTLLGGATGGLAFGITGAVAVLGILVPKIIEWTSNSREAAAAQKEIEQSVLDQLPRLEDLAAQIGAINVALNEQIRALRSQAVRAQQAEIDKNVASIKEMEQRISDNTAKVERWTRTIDEFTARTGKAPGGLQAELAGLNDAIARDTDRVDELSAATVRLMDAQEAGITLQRAETDAVKDGTEARREAKEALDRQRRAQEDLNAAIREGERFQKTFVDQGALARDSERLAKAERERAEAVGDLTEAQVEQLTTFETAEQREAGREKERQKLTEEGAQQDKQAAADDRANKASMVGASVAAAATLFGQNKALRIASIIADTAAAATTAAAGPPGLPWSLPWVALAVATGAANLAAAQGVTLGFDDPMSDLLAEKLGRGSAKDFLDHFGVGFRRGLPAGAVASNTFNQHSQTTINQGGPNVTIRHMVGGDRAAVERWLMRTLARAQRRDQRSRLR